jgi:Raf kinase inhibitor-like YbhB/YbcL family protein
MKLEIPMAPTSSLQLATAVLCFTLGAGPVNSTAAATTEKKPMQLTSSAFTEGGPIPAKYTCDGKNVSPPLKWSGVPENAKALALIVDDPDAPSGTWVHWVLYGLPPTATELAEDTPQSQYTPAGARHGLNDFRRLGYGGPCPPPGKPHRYFFKLYALDAALDLKPGLTKKDVERAMEKHILAQAQLMGTYKRG